MTSVPMRFSIFMSFLLCHLLPEFHAAEPRDTMPDTWSNTEGQADQLFVPDGTTPLAKSTDRYSLAE